jgi:DUF4097 and DUF4098 domain-containing protein YvlB
MRTAASPLSILVVLLGAALSHDARADMLERQVAADLHGIVEISNVSGEIEVSGWDRPEVHVQADLGAGVQRLDVTSESGRTLIKVVLPTLSFSFSGRSGSAYLRIQIPRDSKLDISAVSATVTSTHIGGSQRLRTVSGEIRAEIGAADVEVKTVSGNVYLRGAGQQGSTHVTTISGDMSLERAAGDLEVSTVSGNLDVRLDPARSVRVRTTSGRFSFEGRLVRGASLDAQSVSGEMRVRAPAQAGYEYDVSTFSGHIADCFNVEAERTSRYAPGSRLMGARGEGGGQVFLKTMSGGVELCDR